MSELSEVVGVLGKLEPTQLILVLCLFGAWKLAEKFIEMQRASSDRMNTTLEGIRSDLGDLKGDLKIIATRVSEHEDRLDELERERTRGNKSEEK